jgi:hypothetical protein
MLDQLPHGFCQIDFFDGILGDFAGHRWGEKKNKEKPSRLGEGCM